MFVRGFFGFFFFVLRGVISGQTLCHETGEKDFSRWQQTLICNLQHKPPSAPAQPQAQLCRPHEPGLAALPRCLLPLCSLACCHGGTIVPGSHKTGCSEDKTSRSGSVSQELKHPGVVWAVPFSQPKHCDPKIPAGIELVHPCSEGALGGCEGLSHVSLWG